MVAIIAAIFVKFDHITSADSLAFRILVAAAVISAATAAANVMIGVAHTRQTSKVNHNISDALANLANSIPAIDWSFDSAEHDRAVYQSLRKVVEDPRTMEFKVLTVFRDVRAEEVSGEQRQAIRDYYRSLEVALEQRRGFVYERLVVLRPAIGHGRSASQLLSALLLARPEFVEHCRWLMRPNHLALNSRSDLRFYGDTGRLYDIAFVVALDSHRNPISLLLEIGTTRPADKSARSEHPALGLLALNNPSSQLAEAFLLDHQSLRSETMEVVHISDEVVREILGLS